MRIESTIFNGNQPWTSIISISLPTYRNGCKSMCWFHIILIFLKITGVGIIVIALLELIRPSPVIIIHHGGFLGRHRGIVLLLDFLLLLPTTTITFGTSIRAEINSIIPQRLRAKLFHILIIHLHLPLRHRIIKRQSLQCNLIRALAIHINLRHAPSPQNPRSAILIRRLGKRVPLGRLGVALSASPNDAAVGTVGVGSAMATIAALECQAGH
mmetsp:Transcript_34379/g.63250  ORF Transcript_34379/g.63250 Transcript_34379/m.63250 type:complete len:213 (+) Transcript_34379:301-939(+)